jgi:hypothetical protein
VSHHDAVSDSARAYHSLVAAGLTSPHGHLAAAALAGAVAEHEYACAAAASTPAARRMFLRAAAGARATRERHQLVAAAIDEQLALPSPRCALRRVTTQ